MGLTCRNITVEYPSGGGSVLRVLDGMSASFESGHISLISGPAGGGKSTLLHVLGNLLRPTAGEVLAGGQPVSRWKPMYRDQWRTGMGILFQHLHLLTDLSVKDNILLPLVPRRLPWTSMQDRLQDWLTALDLAEFGNTPVKHLSGGQRQRTAFARAMIGEPGYLLLDEPTSFQDDAAVGTLVEIWRRAARKGTCVVICSHDSRLHNCDQINQRCRIERGKLVQSA